MNSEIGSGSGAERGSARHIVFMNWRDTTNPEGGGSEVFVEQMARGLVARGDRVTVFCASHANAPDDEVRDGIRFVRRGSKTTVYLRGWLLALRRGLGHVDLFVDVQNGIPFFTRLASRTPVLVLVHHVHKEQWQVVYPGLAGRVGWFIESQLARRVSAGCQYVAVSQATRAELVRIGVRAADIAVVHNGSTPALPVTAERSLSPLVLSLGRLVPHKQVEHAIDAVVGLRARHPDIKLIVAGSGWWHDELVAHIDRVGAGDVVELAGHVDDVTKHRLLAQAWVLALPSLKEGWGLVVSEAAQHALPALAYSAAGGTTESITDGVTGLLAVDADDFGVKLRRLVEDAGYRDKLGDAAQKQALAYTWDHATASFAMVADATMQRRRRIDQVDPD